MQFPTIPATDRLRHLYICGSTGTGKSVLLETLAAESLLAGEGVVLIDPHGSLALKVIGHIPPALPGQTEPPFPADQFLYISLADERPVHWNPLDVPRETRSKVAEDLVAAFVHIFGREAVAERSQQVLRNSLRAVMDYGGTFLDVPKMLTDSSHRAVVLTRLEDPFVKDYWTHQFEEYDDRKRDDVISPILNKFDALLTPNLRAILGHRRSTFDLQRHIDDGRILIVNLDTGRVGELPAKFFGALLVTAIGQAAFSRTKDNIVHLYADEFQNYITSGFIRMLAETRKFGLALSLANQTLSALPENIANSILANVGTVVAFRCGHDDATIFAKHMQIDSPQRIQILPNFKAYGRFLIDGSVTDALYLEPDPPPKSLSNAEKLIKNSRIKFGRSCSGVSGGRAEKTRPPRNHRRTRTHDPVSLRRRQ